MLKDKLKLTHLDSDWLELEELRDGSLKRHMMMERERDERVVWRKLERRGRRLTEMRDKIMPTKTLLRVITGAETSSEGSKGFMPPGLTKFGERGGSSKAETLKSSLSWRARGELGRLSNWLSQGR